MPRSRTVTNAVMVAVFAAVCIFATELLAFNIGQPPYSGRPVHAVFSDASGIPNYADVRIAGVVAGHVTDVSHDARFPGATVVTFNLDQGITLHGNASATVRPKTLLEDKYIELLPGDDAHGALADDTIPLAQTAKDVDNDEIFNSLDATTRHDQQLVLQDLDAATKARDGDIRAVLPQLQAMVRDLAPVAQVYEKDDPAVNSILQNLDTVLSALSDEHEQLAGLLANGDVALNAVSQRDDALIATLAEASKVAGEINAASAPTVAAQRQSLQELAPTLDVVHAFFNAVQGPNCQHGTAPCGVDRLIAGTLIGQLNYPNDQLNTLSPEPPDRSASESVSNEWSSMFSFPSFQTGEAQQSDPSLTHAALNLTASFQCDTFTKNLNLTTLLSNPQFKALYTTVCGAVSPHAPPGNGTGSAPGSGPGGTVTAQAGTS